MDGHIDVDMQYCINRQHNLYVRNNNGTTRSVMSSLCLSCVFDTIWFTIEEQ